MNTFVGPSIPEMELLITEAPMKAWLQVIKQAKRSPMTRYRVGCVLWDPRNEKILGAGTSHPDIKFSKILASIHAERHAISNCYRRSLRGAWAIIYTLNNRNGCTWSSCPCYSCALSLYRAKIEKVIFAERTIDGVWSVYTETPKDLIAKAPKTTGLFAREQRVVRI